MSANNEPTTKTASAGQNIFALIALVLTLVLLSQIAGQTRWTGGAKLFAEPRFWPAVGLISMTVFLALHVWQLERRIPASMDWKEARSWLRPLEFVAWFMAYVWLVPVIGYLLATFLFVPLLCWRSGYRSRGAMAASALFAVLTVVIFKTLLQVKIPGAMIYEALPEPLRSFFIVNL
ncbi:MAG: tripartite tricarboxylate transporter TctB family protein [Pseudomonadota bacterium]